MVWPPARRRNDAHTCIRRVRAPFDGRGDRHWWLHHHGPLACLIVRGRRRGRRFAVMLERWRRRRQDRLGALPRRTPVPGSGLHVCPGCRAPFVHPVARSRIDGSRWSMILRCGDCGWQREVVVADDVVVRFDDDVRADRERLAREADAFAAALDRDLIDAADFMR